MAPARRAPPPSDHPFLSEEGVITRWRSTTSLCRGYGGRDNPPYTRPSFPERSLDAESLLVGPRGVLSSSALASHLPPTSRSRQDCCRCNNSTMLAPRVVRLGRAGAGSGGAPRRKESSEDFARQKIRFSGWRMKDGGWRMVDIASKEQRNKRNERNKKQKEQKTKGIENKRNKKQRGQKTKGTKNKGGKKQREQKTKGTKNKRNKQQREQKTKGTKNKRNKKQKEQKTKGNKKNRRGKAAAQRGP